MTLGGFKLHVSPKVIAAYFLALVIIVCFGIVAEASHGRSPINVAALCNFLATIILTLTILALNRDIGRRKVVESALRESREAFRSAFDDAAIGKALVGRDGRWLKVNRSVCDIVGYSRPELLSTTFQDITHPEDLDKDMESIRQMLDGDIRTYRMEKRYIHKQGQIVWVLLNVSKVDDEDGKLAYFISEIEDITTRKHAEEALRKSEGMYRTLVKNFPNGAVILFDQDLRYLVAGGQGLQVVGLSPDTLEGKTVWEVATPETCEIVVPRYRAALQGESAVVEVTYQDHSYTLYALPVRNTDGEIIAGMAMTQDITERNLAAQERERLIGELQSTLAEIKMLSGLLPICASCKNIRDDQGYWNQIEVYIKNHSDAEFSHGICPDCFKNMYPGYHYGETIEDATLSPETPGEP